MEIVGRGFLARHLRRLEDRHPHVVAIAAGVSRTSSASAEEYAREVELVRSVAAQCKASRRAVLFLSTASAGVYGAERPGREDDAVAPRNPYAAHKLALERWLRGYGVDHLVLRLAHVVGPGQPAHQLVPMLARHVAEGRVTLQRGATRDLVAARDVVTVVDELLGRGVTNDVVNVASGTSVPIERIVDHLEVRAGRRAVRTYAGVGTAHAVAIDKLTALVPADALPPFGPAYYRAALDAFVTAGEPH